MSKLTKVFRPANLIVPLALALGLAISSSIPAVAVVGCEQECSTAHETPCGEPWPVWAICFRWDCYSTGCGWVQQAGECSFCRGVHED